MPMKTIVLLLRVFFKTRGTACLCTGKNRGTVQRTYGVNFKREEQIIFSRILASFAFDPPREEPLPQGKKPK